MQRVREREINSHSSPPSSHRKPTIMAVAAVTVDRTIHIQFRRGMGRDGQSGKANMQKSDTNCKLRFCSIKESRYKLSNSQACCLAQLCLAAA